MLLFLISTVYLKPLNMVLWPLKHVITKIKYENLYLSFYVASSTGCQEESALCYVLSGFVRKILIAQTNQSRYTKICTVTPSTCKIFNVTTRTPKEKDKIHPLRQGQQVGTLSTAATV